MSISLQKGQKISLTKDANGNSTGLSKAIVGLGWDAVKRGVFGGGKSIDCDASAILLKNGHLANKSDIKKKILAFAFCYDLPFLIYVIALYLDYSFIDALFYINTWYAILYAGGIFLFYLMLYKEIRKNKI